MIYQQHWQAFLTKHHLAANKNQIAVAAVTPAICPTVATQDVTPLALCGNRALSVYQIPQQTNSYCGPASVQEILYFNGKYPSQKELAGTAQGSNLFTTLDGGTNWWRNIVGPTLNKYISRSTIFYVALNYSNMSESDYVGDFTTDIDGGFPVDSGIEEDHNGPGLIGHPNPPVGYPIQHWVTIRGYTSYGSNTEVDDSAANATSLGWTNAQPYSTLSSTTMYELISPFGIVW